MALTTTCGWAPPAPPRRRTWAAACASPLPSGYPADPVIVALAQWVYLEAPDVAAYFQRAHLPFAEMNTLLQNLNEPGATVESVADAFVAARGEIWQGWVGK